MAWTLIASASSTAGAASAPVNTTGANLIVVELTYYPPSGVPTSVTDSKGNTWTALTAKTAYGNTLGTRLFYCYNPSVGAGHTFTNGAAAPHGLGMQAWSGAAASPFDLESGLGNPSGTPTTIQPGSLTPTQNNELIISGLGYYQAGGAASVDSGMTLTDTTSGLYPSGYNHALAYKVQTTAAAINPTWTIPATTDGFFATVMATFKMAVVVSDLAGNVDLGAAVAAGTLASSPSDLSGGVTLDAALPAGTLGVQPGVITTAPWRAPVTGAVLASATIPKIAVLKVSDMSTVLTLVDVATNASGVIQITSAALLNGVRYLLVACNADGSAFGCESYVAA